MTFSHSVNSYIFDSWRAATRSDANAALREEAFEALAIGNLTGSDLRRVPDIKEGLSSLLQSALDGRRDFRSLVLRFHEAYDEPLPLSSVQKLSPG